MTTPALASDARRDPGRAPGPRFRTPFGFLSIMRRDPLGFLLDCSRRYGDVVEIRFPPFRNILVTGPSGIRHVLQDNHRNYWKGLVLGKLKRIAGEGLVFSDGTLWRRQRQLIQPAFHRERISALAGMMVDTIAARLDRWQRQVGTERPVDVAAEMSHLTLDIVSQALFGADLGDDKEEFTRAVSAAMAYANHDPERFSAERSAGRPDYTYFPFGGGPRGCVGRQFALMEGQLILAVVAQRFRLQAVPGHPIEPDPILTLRPRYGVPMTLHRRN